MVHTPYSWYCFDQVLLAILITSIITSIIINNKSNIVVENYGNHRRRHKFNGERTSVLHVIFYVIGSVVCGDFNVWDCHRDCQTTTLTRGP